MCPSKSISRNGNVLNMVIVIHNLYKPFLGPHEKLPECVHGCWRRYGSIDMEIDMEIAPSRLDRIWLMADGFDGFDVAEVRIFQRKVKTMALHTKKIHRLRSKLSKLSLLAPNFQSRACVLT
ncbi:unnamed protein product [Ambrosiozyma monospora]|uniref:Unnamed protein product n=1 Tax=Ambrosiozyma monospora TaxID=43982 RepID=A0A9W6T5P8_AMBMO|nr:unnamed protein product [Ambrosiozyma monospora]